MTTSWVVGSGGLLGRAVVTELHRRGHDVVTSSVPWADNRRARDVVIDDARRFRDVDNVVWCAGAGVNGTSRDEFAQENDLLGSVLEQLDCGTFFHASSAGGVYAGTPNAPHDENSSPTPLGDYGRAKLDAEALVGGLNSRTVIGRFANLYGPGQNLSKPQGLISHLCRGYLLASPVSIYVPMDTLRDYLFVTDAAEMVGDALEHAAAVDTASITKIFCSGQAVTIGAILGACRSVFHRRPNVVQAASPLSAMQGSDLRLRSVVWPHIDQRTHRTLHAGIASTLNATRSALLF
ncbi:NAD-dependent epimerase/dehydratase family protein [Actinomycetes bacterium M1A6_2h]